MAYPCFNDPFVLHTDTSEVGLGAVLHQKQNGVLKVIAYGSRTLSPAERQWAICEQFCDYLYYAPSFVVYGDNNPLTYVLSSAKLNASGLRWINEVAEFNFTIKHRPGSANGDADTLSRVPLNFELYMNTCTQELSTAEREAVTSAANCTDIGQSNLGLRFNK